jgi:SnoaL-like polyketide cyclase
MADRDERILVGRYIYDLWNEGDVDVADEIFAEHHLYDDVRLPGLARGPEGVRQRFGYYTRAIPGRIVDTVWVVQEGRTTCRWVWEGCTAASWGSTRPPARRWSSPASTSAASATGASSAPG